MWIALETEYGLFDEAVSISYRKKYADVLIKDVEEGKIMELLHVQFLHFIKCIAPYSNGYEDTIKKIVDKLGNLVIRENDSTLTVFLHDKNNKTCCLRLINVPEDKKWSIKENYDMFGEYCGESILIFGEPDEFGYIKCVEKLR